MIAPFTLQKEGILCRGTGARWKAPFFIFLDLFNSAEIDDLELFKFQNVLLYPLWLGQNQGSY